MKIVLVNVKYSPNLGDGIIAECLEHGLRARLEGAEIVNCDLAGRTEYGANGETLRALAMNVLSALPRAARHALVGRLMEFTVRRKLMPFYREQMQGADIVLFSGGQLLADVNLNFPLKVAGAAAVAHEIGAPLGVHGVGVGRMWSYEGAQLFKEAFDGFDMFWATVRDPHSLRRWERHFAGSAVARPELSLDSGLLARNTYGEAEGESREGRNRPLVGLCVTHPASLRLESDEEDEISARSVAALLQDTARALSDRGCETLVFTNGAPEDDAFMRRTFTPDFIATFAPDTVTLTDRSMTPRALARMIGRCDGVIAHRLHALIVAYAYRVPHVGLSLNRKIDGFFQLTGRSEFLIKPGQFAPAPIAEAMLRAIEARIDEAEHRSIIRSTEKDLDGLADAMRRVCAERYAAAAPQQIAAQ